MKCKFATLPIHTAKEELGDQKVNYYILDKYKKKNELTFINYINI